MECSGGECRYHGGEFYYNAQDDPDYDEANDPECPEGATNAYLAPGIHPITGELIRANWSGPGNCYTQARIKGRPPKSDIDYLAMQHDRRYTDAFRVKDPTIRERKIRYADNVLLKDAEQYQDDPFYMATVAGITAKKTFEDTAPEFVARKVLGNYYGKSSNKGDYIHQ